MKYMELKYCEMWDWLNPEHPHNHIKFELAKVINLNYFSILLVATDSRSEGEVLLVIFDHSFLCYLRGKATEDLGLKLVQLQASTAVQPNIIRIL